jgi:hypothetical protein
MSERPMRGHRAGTAAAALAAVALACLTACGTAASPQTFRPAGGDPAAGQGGPGPVAHFPFPADVHFDFATPLPPDPAQAAAVVADQNFQLAYYYGIYSQGRDRRYSAYIGDRLELATVQETIAQEVAVHEGFTGTIVFYDTTVQSAAWKGRLTVSSCVDNSRLLDTDIRTGQLRRGHAAPDRSHFLESDILASRAGGDWRVVGTGVTYYPHGQAKECAP